MKHLLTLEELTEEEILEISNSCFENCDYLKTIVLPTDLHIIDSHVFRNCNNLCSVGFGPNIETIKKGAFENCQKIKKAPITAE